MGAWIEIKYRDLSLQALSVAPHMGAWIEIISVEAESKTVTSHPTWVRGLKSIECEYNMLEEVVAPHMGAWIEM